MIHVVCPNCERSDTVSPFDVSWVEGRGEIAGVHRCEGCGQGLAVRAMSASLRAGTVQTTPEERAAEREANQRDLAALRQEVDEIRYGTWTT